MALARRAVRGLRARSRSWCARPAAGAAGRPVPFDTRLDAAATAAALGVELPGLDTQLARLRHEMEDADVRYDLITMGRVGVDLYPEQVGVPLAEVRTFAKSLGGSATNVAVAAARLGARAAVITKVGDDPFGPYMRDALRGLRRGRRAGSARIRRCARPSCSARSSRPTTSRCCSTASRTAPDMTIAADELDLDAIGAARAFWTTGHRAVGRAQPRRDARRAGRPRRAARGAITMHDLDHRPMFWADEAEAGRWAREALAHATVAVGNRDEVGGRRRDARSPSGGGGAAGARGRARRGQARARRVCSPARAQGRRGGRRCPWRWSTAWAPATRSAVRSSTGCWKGWALERAVRLANAAGAHVAGRLAVRRRDADARGARSADTPPTLPREEAVAAGAR